MIKKIISILIAITITVIAYYLVLWVLELLGIHPPQNLVTACFVLIALISVGGAISGRFDSWWGI